MIAAGLLTFIIRLSFILLLGKVEIPVMAQKALRLVPPAVLTAIFVPDLLLRQGQVDVTLNNARLFAGVLAGLVAWKSKNAVLTIITGMIALWLLQLILH